MTAEAAVPGLEVSGSVALEIGRQATRRESLQAVGLLMGILVILVVVTLVLGVTPPGV